MFPHASLGVHRNLAGKMSFFWGEGKGFFAPLLCFSVAPCPPFLSPVRVDYLAGVVLNEGINFAIKHIVKEPSPATGE